MSEDERAALSRGGRIVATSAGFAAPISTPPWLQDAVQAELERHARNAEAAAREALAGRTGYLRESILGVERITLFLPPPSRRVRIRRALAEARRRIREAALILRTGAASYDED